jgi:hypothetical protein
MPQLRCLVWIMRKYRMRVFRPNGPKPRLLVQKWVILAEDDAAATTLAWQRYDTFRKETAEADEYPFGMLRAAVLSFSLSDGTRLVCDSRREGVFADVTRTPRREAFRLFRQPLRPFGRAMSVFRGAYDRGFRFLRRHAKFVSAAPVD